MQCTMLQNRTKSAWYCRPEYIATAELKLFVFTSYFEME